MYPTTDPWGKPFASDYHPDRMAMAGKPLPLGYRAVLEGIQSDQDYLRILFNLQTGPSRQRVCHYCDQHCVAIQWVSNKPQDQGPGNSPELLYTVFGKEGDNPHLD